MILPARNRKDVLNDLPESTRKEMTFAFISTVEELLEEVWGRDVWAVKPRYRIEARL